jgi:subtilisin family serine protease
MSTSMGRRALLLGAAVVLSLAFAAPASAEKYIVLYKASSVPAGAERTIENAGGRVVAAYDEIGVVVADSDAASFRNAVMRDNRVEGAEGTSRYATRLQPVQAESHDEQPPELPNAPAGQDPLFSLQWDMRQIDTPRAHAVTGGSPAVVTGIIDTGVDKDHPDLVQNIDFSKSASCESGAPDQNPAAWDDRNGHGTHTAGTTAAPQNGFGITGVAPNTKLAAIKSSTDAGFFFPEMVVCSFMWAGGAPFDNPATPGVDIPASAGPRVDVTNNSYFADPFLYNCRNDPVQRAIWKAEKRAIDFAEKQGVTHVAAIGNDSDDRAHPAFDVISPDFPPGEEEERVVTNACVVVPVEVDGVIGVTGVGNTRQTDNDDDPNDFLKSFYSAYGVGVAEVTAPGGDSIFGVTAEAPNGRVLSTWPAEIPCTRRVQDPPPPPEPTAVYCYLQGTSMASPHVAGVAALIVSRFGDLDNPQNGKMRPGSVAAYIQQTADPQPCPAALPPGYEAFTRPHFAGEEGEPQECQGGPGYNSWYGNGQVNAFKAVTHDTSNR